MIGGGSRSGGQPPAKSVNVRYLPSFSRYSAVKVNAASPTPQILVQQTSKSPSPTHFQSSNSYNTESEPSEEQVILKSDKRYICQSCPFHVEFPNEEVYLRHMDLAHVNNPAVLRAQALTSSSGGQHNPHSLSNHSQNVRYMTTGNESSQTKHNSKFQVKGGFALSRSALEHLVSSEPLGLSSDEAANAQSTDSTQLKRIPKKHKTSLSSSSFEEGDSWIPENIRNQPPKAKRGRPPNPNRDRSKLPKMTKLKKASPVHPDSHFFSSEMLPTTGELLDDVESIAIPLGTLNAKSKKVTKPRFCCLMESCRCRLNSGEDLMEHVLANHEHENAYVCGTCFAMFTRPVNFVSHMNESKHEDRMGCLGRATAAKEAAMALGEETEPETPQNRSYFCKACEMAFADKTELIEHKRSEHPLQACKTCGEEFTSMYFLKKHRKAMHNTANLNHISERPESASKRILMLNGASGDEEILQVSSHTSFDLGSPRPLSSSELAPSLPHASILISMNEDEERALISDVLGESSNGERVHVPPQTEAFSVFSCEHCMALCLSAQELEQHLHTLHSDGLNSKRLEVSEQTPSFEGL